MFVSGSLRNGKSNHKLNQLKISMKDSYRKIAWIEAISSSWLHTSNSGWTSIFHPRRGDSCPVLGKGLPESQSHQMLALLDPFENMPIPDLACRDSSNILSKLSGCQQLCYTSLPPSLAVSPWKLMTQGQAHFAISQRAITTGLRAWASLYWQNCQKPHYMFSVS